MVGPGGAGYAHPPRRRSMERSTVGHAPGSAGCSMIDFSLWFMEPLIERAVP